ncbi:AAA family ATPase [Halanaerocella petrolearia]
MIEKVEVENFKSIEKLDLELNDFCVFIGANSSGKSNIVDIFKFIRDILKNDLKSAINSRFGWENLLTKWKDNSEKINISLSLDMSRYIQMIDFNDEIQASPLKFDYNLSIGSKKKNPYVFKEKVYGEWEVENRVESDSFYRDSEEIKFDSQIGEFQKVEEGDSIKVPKKFENELFLNAPFFSLTAMILSDLMEEFKYYEIDANKARKTSSNDSNDFLEENGSNLSLVLENLESEENKKTKSRIESIMRTLVPEFKGWETERQFDATLGFKILERGVKDGFLPKMISDGTIRLLSILIALLFQREDNRFIAIDEPERCLHPQVLKTLVEVMREVSKNKQIFVTTHSPEIVKWLKPEETYLVDKKDNKTFVKRADNINNMDKFLENFSMEELWLSGYLKGGNIV